MLSLTTVQHQSLLWFVTMDTYSNLLSYLQLLTTQSLPGYSLLSQPGGESMLGLLHPLRIHIPGLPLCCCCWGWPGKFPPCNKGTKFWIKSSGRSTISQTGGVNPKRVGVATYNTVKFSPKLQENKENWAWGARIPTPFKTAMINDVFLIKQDWI